MPALSHRAECVEAEVEALDKAFKRGCELVTRELRLIKNGLVS